MTNQWDLFSKGLIRNPDYDTSIEAAIGIEDRLSELQQKVFNVLDVYPDGLTDEQLRNLPPFVHMVPRTIDKRRTDLVHKGQVIGTEERRINKNGRKMIVWKTVTHASPDEIVEWSRQQKVRKCPHCGGAL